MKVSMKGDYGVRALVELAHHFGEGPGRGPADARSTGDLAGPQVSAAKDDWGNDLLVPDGNELSRQQRVVNWFTPKIALARIAWLRTILYLFVILDMHAFVRDTRLKGEHPGLYQPLFLARLLDLPKPSVANTTTLYFVLIVACLVASTNRLPKIADWVIAPAFT